jgi:endoglycosylceramidase
MINTTVLRRAPAAAAALIFICMISGNPAARAESWEPCADCGELTRLRSEGGFLLDAYGRVTLLRGANVPAHCYKPMTFGGPDLDALEGFGFNFIRLGISWDKAEPEEGSIDLAYIRSLVDFARLAGERGMYVMPEVHKYGWCAPGSDWPMWACDPPVKDGSDFVPMLRNARRFWNSPDLQEKLIGFWKILVVEFRGLDNVMGYNPMNEPLDISMLVPGAFDKKLFAFYEKWIVAVRELDPDRPACLEPSTANMIVGLKPPPFNHDNLVYAPHPYYVHGDGLVIKESNRKLEKKYRRIAREAKALNAPLLIGEYGGDPDTEFGRRWLTRSFELQDEHFAGMAIWVYNNSGRGWDLADPEYNPRPFFQKALRRPYPRFTAGKPIELKYSVQDRAFTYRYEPDHGISAPTEVYLPREPAEGAVTVRGGEWSYDENSQIMFVRPNPGSGEVVIEAR